MNKFVVLAIFIFGPSLCQANIEQLIKGVGVNDNNINDLAQTSWEYAKSSTTQKKFDDGFARAFYRKENSNDLYSLSRTPKIYLTNFETREVLGNWPLSRWPHLKRPPAIMNTLLGYGSETPWREEVEYTAHKPFAGCLNQSPLRYGDIEEDGVNEIVLFLNGELIVFSPKYERIVFADFLQADDWFNDPNWDRPIGPADSGKYFQHYSEQLLLNGHAEQGFRHYSKVFVGNFDGDRNPDIIRWSKTYASYEKNEAKGFYLVRNDLKHYERDLSEQKRLKEGVTGEYLPQITMDVVIEGWMREHNLTWQKGFPSKSECAGQEDQLIPEMHDPLLNDPDVLK